MRETLRTVFEQLAALGIVLIQAALVFLVAALVVRGLRRLIRRRLETRLVPANVKRIVENIVAFLVLALGATILLTHWGANWTTLLTAIGLSTLVAALGLQSVLQSLVAGIFILFERPFNVGDRISYSVHRISGTVEEISWRTTIVRDDEGARLVVPNSLALTNVVINSSPERAILTIVTVHGAGGHGRTLHETRALAASVLADVPWPAASPDVTVHSRLSRVHLPQPVVRLPRFGRRLDAWVKHLVDESTQVRVTWTGVRDPAVRAQVQHRLGDCFPQSRITIRRW